jgi:hypothetical protein
MQQLSKYITTQHIRNRHNRLPLNRLKPHSENITGKYQTGFRKDRSTTDQINRALQHVLGIRCRCESLWNFEQAYDSTDSSFKRKILIRIFGPVYENDVGWRLKYN